MTDPGEERGARIASDSVALVFSRLLKQLTGWGFEVLLVRALVPETWDHVSRLLTVSLGAVLLGQFGFPESVLAFGSRADSDSEAKAVLYRATAVLASVGALFTLVLVAIPPASAYVLGTSTVSVVLAFGTFLLSELVVTPIPSFLVARRHVRLAGAYALASRVPSILGVCVALAIGNGIEHVVWGLAVGSALSALLGFLCVERVSPGKVIRREELSLRLQVAFAAPVGLSRVAQVVHQQLDKYVVMAMLPALFGTYYLGAVEMPFVPMVCQVVGSVTMPDMVRAAGEGKRERILEIFRRTVEKMALLAYPIFTFLMVFSDAIFVVVYGPDRVSAAMPFRIFQVLLLHRFAAYGLLLQAVDRPRVPLVAAVITVVINAPLSIVLSNHFGAAGAAAATVIATYVSSIYTFREIGRSLDVSFTALLPLRKLALTLGAASLSVLGAYIVARLVPSQRVGLVVAGVVHLALFVLLGRAVGVVGAAEARFALSLARLRFLRRSSGDA